MQRPTGSIRVKDNGSKQKFSKHLQDCVLKNCCNSCSYCCWSRAAAKERPKSRSLSDRNKACKKCFFCLSVPPVPNVPNVANSPPVGGRLQRFWETWLSLGSNPRVISILKEGYNLPFKMRPPLTRSPLIISGYANPLNGTECLLGWLQAIGQRPRKIDKTMMARCLSTVGEPCSEIPHAPHLFTFAALCMTCILLQGKDLIFFIWIYLSFDTDTTSVSL